MSTRKTLFVASNLVLLAGMGLSANAAVIASDSFTGYAAGPILGQDVPATGFVGAYLNNGNADFSATSLDFADPLYLAETGGSVTIPAGTADAQDNGRQGRILATPVTADTVGTVYLSVLLQTGTDNVDSYRAFELHNGGFGDGVRQFQLGFQNGDFDSDGTNYGFNTNAGGDGANQLDVNDGGVNLFVARFDLAAADGADSVTVYQNPTLTEAGVEPLTEGTTVLGQDFVFDRATFARFGLSDGINFDELRFGETFADVTTVPEPASLALLGLGGLALLGSRKRK